LEEYNNLKNEIYKGDVTSILKTVKSEDEKAFNKLADNFLDTIGKIDSTARLKIAARVVKQALGHSVKTAKSWQGSSNEKQKDDGGQLELAAKIIHQYLFDEPEVSLEVGSSSTENEEDPRAKELSQREQEFAKKQLDLATARVTKTVDNTFRNTIEKHIDPKEVMTPYVKERAIEDCMKYLRAEFREDNRFQKILDKLWQNSYSNNFDEKSEKAIRDALLKRGKTSLSTIISRVRTEALKGVRKASSNGKSQEEEKPTKYRSSGSPERKSSEKPADSMRGKSTLDALNEMLR